MRTIVFAAIGLAVLATPAVGGTPHSGVAGHDQHRYGVERPGDFAREHFAAPGATVAPQGFGLIRRAHPARPAAPRTGLDRPYGGHGVPYSTPPQGWPEKPPF